MFHTQEVQGSERRAEAQGSEMSRALLAQTPGVTGLQQVLKGQKLSQEKEAKRGRSSAYRLSPAQDSKVHLATVSLLQSC